MKYFLPELDVSENDGFKSDLDIFHRKNMGENLAQLLKNTDQSIVLAIDNKWGEGKTTFLKMWRGYLKEKHDIKSIYFDAFSNDHIQDPFSALLAELYSYISDNVAEDSEAKKDFKDKAKKAGVAVLKGSLKVGIRYLTMNAFDGSFLDGNNEGSNKIDKAVADELVQLSENTVQHFLDNYENAKAEIEQFKIALNTVLSEASENTPLIFIIDEIDRCKPSYSVELLEKLKHIFTVPNVHFVLSMNKKQLEACIKGVYGHEVDANLYIQKFINLSVTLPMAIEDFDGLGDFHIDTHIENLIKRHEITKNGTIAKIQSLFSEIAVLGNYSFRDCEKIFTIIAIQIGIRGASSAKFLVPLACIKIFNPNLFLKTYQGKINFCEMIKCLQLPLSHYKTFSDPLKEMTIKLALLGHEDINQHEDLRAEFTGLFIEDFNKMNVRYVIEQEKNIFKIIINTLVVLVPT